MFQLARHHFTLKDSKQPFLLIIAGATATGKSSYALELANHLDGEIINCDAIQLYNDLPSLTARPNNVDETQVKHWLYGKLEPLANMDVVNWIRQANDVVDNILARGKWPIMVGGTGMYIETFLNGIAPVPDIPPETLNNLKEKYANVSLQDLVSILSDLSKEDAAAMQDKQRIIRAIAVNNYTGRSLTSWWKKKRINNYKQPWLGTYLDLSREQLRNNCAFRFKHMISGGAIQEVSTLLRKLNIDTTNHPDIKKGVWRAIGAKQLASNILGELGQEEAINGSITSTCQYAKRQQTWFRNRLPKTSWQTIKL